MIKHIYLISIDALRFDCVGSHKKDKLFNSKYSVLLDTPTLNYLVSKSINFTQTTTAAPYTSASHASIFTGLYPPKHNVRALLNPGDQSLAKNVLTLAEIFASEGFKTLYASDEESMTCPLNVDRGFKYYFQNNDKRLINYIQRNKNEKLFIFKHFFDVHDPYLLTRYKYNSNVNDDLELLLKKKADEEHISFSKSDSIYDKWRKIYGGTNNNREELLPLYLKGVSKFDKGRFKLFIDSLRKIGEFNNSLFIFFSDHSEGRCNSNNLNFFAHGGELYDEVMRVPLYIYHKKLMKRQIMKQTSLVDIFPTVLDIVFNNKQFLKPRYKINGLSLLDDKQNHKFTYAEFWRSDKEHPQDYPTNKNWLLCQRVIRTSKSKLLLFGQPENIASTSFSNLDINDVNKFLMCKFSDIKINFIDKANVVEYINQFLTDMNSQIIKFYDLEKDPKENNSININGKKRSFKIKILSKYFINLIYKIDEPNISFQSQALMEKIPYLKSIYNSSIYKQKPTVSSIISNLFIYIFNLI